MSDRGSRGDCSDVVNEDCDEVSEIGAMLDGAIEDVGGITAGTYVSFTGAGAGACGTKATGVDRAMPRAMLNGCLL